MAFRSDHGFRPYVPVARRRILAQKAAKKLAAKGRTLTPVQIEGRAIATSFWGQAWCSNLESYSDFANRLPRGRTYVRNGSVIDLQIAAGTITAVVHGSSLYKIKIKIAPLKAKHWRAFKKRCAGEVTHLFDLLQGRLSKGILADLTAHSTGLFPAPSEINLGCSCPDWADMCKHVAAALYGAGARLDHDPALFFTLRGVDMQELITAAGNAAATDLTGTGPSDTALDDADLSTIFGVELDPAGAGPEPTLPSAAIPARKRSSSSRVRRAAKPTTKSRQTRKTGKKTGTSAQSGTRPTAAKKKPKKKPKARSKRSSSD